MRIHRFWHDGPWDGPSAGDLAAIEREWPLIEAEVALVGAEIRVLTAEPGPCELDWRRVRRAERRFARELLALLPLTDGVATLDRLVA